MKRGRRIMTNTMKEEAEQLRAAAEAHDAGFYVIRTKTKRGVVLKVPHHYVAPEALAEIVAPPPEEFTFLLACLARPGRAEELIGDAESEYHQMVLRLGVSRAQRWYSVHVMKMAGRMLPGAVMRLLLLHKLFGLFGF
jgi:hypothetical protein